jgi:hypothetical protein
MMSLLFFLAVVAILSSQGFSFKANLNIYSKSVGEQKRLVRYINVEAYLSCRRSLLAANKADVNDSAEYSIPKVQRGVYFAGAVGLLLYALTLAPGGTPEAAAIDSTLIAKLISPSSYDGSVNALFVFLFNAFLIVPGVYAGLLLPASKKQCYPTLAFIAASFGFGFFALGPYLGLRTTSTNITKSEVGRGTALFSNKFSAAVLLAFGLYLAYYVVQQTMGMDGGLSAQLASFWKLFTTQRLVHVSALDMTFLSLAVSRMNMLLTYYKIKGNN